MAALTRYVFACCCMRSRPRSTSEPDERSPFIQPTDEVPPVRNYTVDHQKMKKRLGEIVRSQEGKMVNVNQTLPFNLHNRPLYGRSLSINTTPPRPTSNTSPDLPSTSTYPYQSLSRDPSPSIQTSRSTSSLHPGDASYLPPEADPDGGIRHPILNARLVRGPGGSLSGERLRQGRSATRGRLGRFGEERGDGAESELVNGKRKCTECGGDAILEVQVQSPSTMGNLSLDRNIELLAAQNENGASAEGSGSVAPDRRAVFHAPEFKIEDVGNLSQSWGE